MTEVVQSYVDSGDWDNAILSCTSVAEEDEVIALWESSVLGFELPDEYMDTIIQEGKTIGWKEENNPLISFIKLYKNKNGNVLPLDKYILVHNLYANGVIDNPDLNGKSKDGISAIIFNSSLYTQNNNSIEYIVKLYYWCITENNLNAHIKVPSFKRFFNNFNSLDSMIKFRNALIFKPGNVDLIINNKLDTSKFVEGNSDGEIYPADTISKNISKVSVRVGDEQNQNQQDNKKSNLQTTVDSLANNIDTAKQIMQILVDKFGDSIKW